MADIYEEFSNIYFDKITKKNHYQILTRRIISLAGATEYIIPSEMEYRPDLISLAFYGTDSIDDLLTMANGFTDPIKDYYVGRKMFIPTIGAINDILY